MRVIDGQQALLRIFVGESDRHDGRPLYQALVEMFREEKLAGATVLRGVLGFGANSRLHSSSLLRLSQDLPMVIEVVDTQEHIDRVWPRIEAMVGDCLITTEKVNVVRYGKKSAE
jgi:hypothetical protein